MKHKAEALSSDNHYKSVIAPWIESCHSLRIHGLIVLSIE